MFPQVIKTRDEQEGSIVKMHQIMSLPLTVCTGIVHDTFM